MADYELRAQAFETGLVTRVKRTRRLKYTAYNNNDELSFKYHDIEALFDQLENPVLYREAVKAAVSDFARNSRLKKRIQRYLLQGDCLFVTLTFRDEVLANTSSETRRKYVLRFLKAHSDDFVGNIDFGEEHDREHYHAVIACSFIPVTDWKQGFSFIERIKTGSNPLKLAKYVSKLANHAVKVTCKRNHLIYSRSSKLDERDEHFAQWFDSFRHSEYYEHYVDKTATAFSS